MLNKYNRKINNLIASFQGLPRDHSRAFWRKEKGMDAVMDQVIQKFKIITTQPEEIIAAEWISLVGEHNAKHANPWRLDRNGRLFVMVNNPVVKQEMLFHKKLLLTRINELPGCQGIYQIVFRAG